MSEGAKICTNCGKVAAPMGQSSENSNRQFSNFSGSQGMTPGASSRTKTTYASHRSARQMKAPEANYGQASARRRPDANYDPVKQAAQQRVPFVTNETSGKEKNRSRLSPIIGAIIKIIIALLIVYVVLSFAMVMLVRNAEYDFKLGKGISLECSTYGEAFDNYFEDGKWRFDIKSRKVTFEGTSYDKEKYEITFGRKEGQTVVQTMYIDDKRIDGDKIMDVYVMGMFMTEKRDK